MGELSRENFYAKTATAPRAVQGFFETVIEHFKKRNDIHAHHTDTNGGDLRLALPAELARHHTIRNFSTLYWQSRNQEIFVRSYLSPEGARLLVLVPACLQPRSQSHRDGLLETQGPPATHRCQNLWHLAPGSRRHQRPARPAGVLELPQSCRICLRLNAKSFRFFEAKGVTQDSQIQAVSNVIQKLHTSEERTWKVYGAGRYNLKYNLTEGWVWTIDFAQLRAENPIISYSQTHNAYLYYKQFQYHSTRIDAVCEISKLIQRFGRLSSKTWCEC